MSIYLVCLYVVKDNFAITNHYHFFKTTTAARNGIFFPWYPKSFLLNYVLIHGSGTAQKWSFPL